MADLAGRNLLEPEPTLLPEEPDVIARLKAGDEAVDLAAKFPTSSRVWAILADEAFAEGSTIKSYAYARVGYHRGLDSLRKAGWRGTGAVPYAHEPNRGFLRALYALGRAAGAIGETDEANRIAALLNDSDPTAIDQLAG